MHLSRYIDPHSGELDLVIAQAEGMISGQANVSIANAVRALDDYCRTSGETKHAAAVQVTERQLRFSR